jgi:hypothetical protein
VKSPPAIADRLPAPDTDPGGRPGAAGMLWGEEADGAQALQHLLECRDGQWSAMLGRYRLATHFQPIYSLAHRRCVGHEALLRAQDEQGGYWPNPRPQAG